MQAPRHSTICFQEETIEYNQDPPVLEERRMSFIAKAKRRVSLVLKKATSPQRESFSGKTPEEQQKTTPRSDTNDNYIFDADSFYSYGGSTSASASSLSNSFSSTSRNTPRISFSSIFQTFTCPSGNTKQLEVSSDFEKMKHDRMRRAKYYDDQLEHKKVKSLSNTRRERFRNKLKSRTNQTNTINSEFSLFNPTQQSRTIYSFERLIIRKLKMWNWTFYEHQ